jgi:hypothetical protein
MKITEPIIKGPTIMESTDCSFEMKVKRDLELNDERNTASLEATLYK